MRNLAPLIPLLLLACSSDDKTTGITPPVPEATCPDTGCAPYVPPVPTVDGFHMWIDFAYDADGDGSLPTFDLPYLTQTDPIITVWWWGDGDYYYCSSVWSIADFDVFKGEGGGGGTTPTTTTTTTTGTTPSNMTGNAAVTLSGTTDGGSTDCPDGVFDNFESSDALAVFANMDMTITITEEMAPGYEFLTTTYDYGDTYFGTLISVPAGDYAFFSQGWEYNADDWSVADYTSVPTSDSFTSGELNSGVYWALNQGFYFY